jgi:bifunctional non-homologous end joining protein LigD
VPPYAIRPKPQAPVAVPITWDELEESAPDRWTVRTIAERLAEAADPWPKFARRARSLETTKGWLAKQPR